MIIKLLKIENHNDNAARDQTVRLRMAAAVLEYLETRYGNEIAAHEALARVKERYERMIEYTSRKPADAEAEESRPEFLTTYRRMLLEIVAVRRKKIVRLRREKTFSDELLREK